jgi:hypothetical protein
MEKIFIVMMAMVQLFCVIFEQKFVSVRAVPCEFYLADPKAFFF